MKRTGMLLAMAASAGLAWALAGTTSLPWPGEPDRADAGQLAHWQAQAAALRDPQALAALRRHAGGGDGRARLALGLALIDQRDPALREEGAAALGVAAELGDAQAHFALGKRAMRDHADRRRDLPAAWRHLEAAARAGHGGAAYYLGLMQRGGYGRPAAPQAAVRSFELGVQQGMPGAMFMLANLLRDGEGVPRDVARAVRLYDEAARMNHLEAIQALALAYQHGELGLQRDEHRFQELLAWAADARRNPALAP